MAVLKIENRATYILEMDQNEAEVVTALVGAVNSQGRFKEVASNIWDVLEDAVQGRRADPVVDGVMYAVPNIEVDVSDSYDTE